jgi:hypothetical protein
MAIASSVLVSHETQALQGTEDPMKPVIFVVFILSALCPLAAQVSDDEATMRREFPLILEITASYVSDNAGISLKQLAEAEAMGSAPPTFAVFKGILSTYAPEAEREQHWQLGCWAENARYAQNPCVDMPIGPHRARWVHNREMLEVLAYDKGGDVMLRYLDVTANPKDPPQPSDPVESSPTFAGLFNANEETRKDYPELVHVYGAVALSLPAGSLPARTSCDIKDMYFSQATHIDCRQYPPVELHTGYVVLDAGIDGNRQHNISCDAKWRWSKCSVIGPGIYEARWKDSAHSQILLLGKRDGKLVDIGFQVR